MAILKRLLQSGFLMFALAGLVLLHGDAQTKTCLIVFSIALSMGVGSLLIKLK